MFCETVAMFMLLSVTLCFLGYVVLLKLTYNRIKQQWTVSLNRLLLSLRKKKDTNFLSIYDRSVPSSSSSEKAHWSARDVRALLVTAHPDDECMFFAPSIIKLVESNAAVHLLCMSPGNYYGQGAKRKEELTDSCAVLGIPAHRVTVIDNKQLPDDPKAEWNTGLTSSLILKHVTAHDINLVVTFDEGGVSGHANHIAVFKALSHLVSVGRIPQGCHVLQLNSISIFRKYLSIFELPISWLLPSSFCCVIGPEEYKRAKEAMMCHRSQLMWFRRFYILLSRYMFVNTFRVVNVDTKNVKIY